MFVNFRTESILFDICQLFSMFVPTSICEGEQKELGKYLTMWGESWILFRIDRWTAYLLCLNLLLSLCRRDLRLFIIPHNLVFREDARNNSSVRLFKIHFTNKNERMIEYIITIGIMMDCAIAEYVVLELLSISLLRTPSSSECIVFIAKKIKMYSVSFSAYIIVRVGQRQRL